MSTDMDWLPPPDSGWEARLGEARALDWPAAKPAFEAVSKFNLDLLQTIKLDRAVSRSRQAAASDDGGPITKLAILGSSTMAHLLPGIRIGALRRGLIVDCFEGHYGMYMQELSDPGSALHGFQPHVILLNLDARHIVQQESVSVDQAVARIGRSWSEAKANFNCAIIQQTLLPIFMPAIGNNDHRLASSPSHLVEQINTALRPAADAAGVHLLAIDAFMRWHGGIDYWYDSSLWNHAKQEVNPRASHLYGEQVGRLLGAIRGLAAKCLVLDLDNTLWGGVIGDDGLEGIALGQGAATGESFVEFQRYAKSLLKQGIILAVCSKNDEANALQPFREHPDMVLKVEDIACFVANWTNKAENLRSIATSLNIGLDALVFADDNPVERGLIRRELPMVAVPELPEDPAYYAQCIARGGYFEALSITAEDQERGALYAANAERDKLRDSVTDMDSYLAALNTELIWQPFDKLGLSRIVQLANKTNQFNLTTTRYVDRDIERAIADPDALTLQLRAKDIYGDNGVISLIVGRRSGADLFVETWLMSCRVLGRQVEQATLNLLVERAREIGARQIVGEYRPTAKNGMVRDHYAKLGFEPLVGEFGAAGVTRWVLNIDDFQPTPTAITTLKGPHARSAADLHSAQRDFSGPVR